MKNSYEGFCPITTFGSANMGVPEAVEAAQSLIKMGELDSAGRQIVNCEPCGAQFRLDESSTEATLSERRAGVLKLIHSPVIGYDQPCGTVERSIPGFNVMGLNTSWLAKLT